MAILADSINNNGIYAVRAEADKDGNRIDTTYAKKTDLSAYATDSELANGLATKQNTISDLATIRSGASAGATAVQPSQLPSSDELVPSATSVDAGKVLTVDSNGDPSWQNVPAPSVDEVPDVTSADDGKVLTASYSGGTGSYSWQTGSQVDIKTEVVGGVTATTTTTSTFEVDIPYDTTNVAYVILKVSDSAVGDLGFSSNELSNVYPVLIDPHGSTYAMSDYLFPTEAAPSGSTYNRLVLGEHTTTKSITIEINDGARSFLQRNDGGKLRLAYGDNVAGYVDTNLTSGLTVTLATPDAEQVVSEINDMKLKPGVPYPYTAGITDIQQVAALPANPVATVLYLIPST